MSLGYVFWSMGWLIRGRFASGRLLLASASMRRYAQASMPGQSPNQPPHTPNHSYVIIVSRGTLYKVHYLKKKICSY